MCSNILYRITEATNATKDRVKYLEALYRHLEALSTDTDPVNLVNNTIPSLFNGIQQIENMTKFFSKNGYLGLLLTKVQCYEFDNFIYLKFM